MEPVPLLNHSAQVGHKMNSYTISELRPSSDYNVMLCLKKNKHIIPVRGSGAPNTPSRWAPLN